MSSTPPILPKLSEADRTPVLDSLLEYIQWQSSRLSALEDEVQQLKGQTRKPRFQSSDMDKHTDDDKDDSNSGGSDDEAPRKRKRRQKKANLAVHEEQVIQPADIPGGSRFKGYRDILVQDLMIQPHTIRYRLAQYETTDGHYISGTLPTGIRGKHWGSTLHSFILY